MNKKGINALSAVFILVFFLAIAFGSTWLMEPLCKGSIIRWSLYVLIEAALVIIAVTGFVFVIDEKPFER